MSKKPSRAGYVYLVIALLFIICPIIWMYISSFKTNMALYKIPPEWIPRQPTLDNYLGILRDKMFMRYYLNNIIVSLLTTLVTVLASVLGGYALSRYSSRGTNLVILALLSTQMFPAVGIISALYLTYKKMGLLNTHLGLILALTAGSMPFCLALMKGYFDDIPTDLEEAAYIDGCGKLSALFRIIVPLASPGILAVALYSFLISWDDYLYCLTLITNDNLRTLSTGISLRYLGELSYDWATVMTVSVMGSLPLLILFIFLQRYMVEGLTAGALKG